jgi:hypothetical protein
MEIIGDFSKNNFYGMVGMKMWMRKIEMYVESF